MNKFLKDIDTNATYIICPNMKCRGFLKDIIQCTISESTVKLFPELKLKTCPHLNEAKLVVFCSNKHSIESKITINSWIRADCSEPNCNSCSFARMSNIKIRIPLKDYINFKNKKKFNINYYENKK